jgi:hypothetical protein
VYRFSVSVSLSLSLSVATKTSKQIVKKKPSWISYVIKQQKKGKKKQIFRGRKPKSAEKSVRTQGVAKMLCWMKMQEVYVVGSGAYLSFS